MALMIDMNDDIRKFEPKFIGPFTKRQCICLAIGLGVGCPIGLLLMPSFDMKIIVSLLLAAPFIACGWITPGGMGLEVYLTRQIYRRFLTPTKRKYKIKNVYRSELNKIKKDQEKKALNALSKREQKRYEKNKNQVTYSKKAQYAIHR